MTRLRARAKALLARWFLLVEFCHDCGCSQPLVWTANDALWQRLADGQHPLCPACFDRRARRAYIQLRWVPVVEHGGRVGEQMPSLCGDRNHDGLSAYASGMRVTENRIERVGLLCGPQPWMGQDVAMLACMIADRLQRKEPQR